MTDPQREHPPQPRVVELPTDMQPLAPMPDFTDQLDFLAIELDPTETHQLGRYLALLLWMNQRMNLTAIRDPHDAWTKHIIDSLTLIPLIASADACTVIDIGSGGGLPGIPLAITMPDVHFTLLEATRKKAAFLEQVINRMHLSNVTIINDRAESAGQDRDHFRERFDVAIARAVGSLPVLVELAVPFVREHGTVLAIKGEKAMEELEAARDALHALHCHHVDTRSTPTGRIVIIEKQRRTPRLYPRSPGEPKRAPIGGKRPRGS